MGTREDTVLKPGEERRLELPTGTPVVIRSAAGFRPSAKDPNSRDTRLLGVYIRP